MRGRTRRPGHRKYAMAGGGCERVRRDPRCGWFRPHPADGRVSHPAGSGCSRLISGARAPEAEDLPDPAVGRSRQPFALRLPLPARGHGRLPDHPVHCRVPPRAPAPLTRRYPAPPAQTGPARCSIRRRQAPSPEPCVPVPDLIGQPHRHIPAVRVRGQFRRDDQPVSAVHHLRVAALPEPLRAGPRNGAFRVGEIAPLLPVRLPVGALVRPASLGIALPFGPTPRPSPPDTSGTPHRRTHRPAAEVVAARGHGRGGPGA